MDYLDKILREIESLSRKIDRVRNIVQNLPSTHNLNLGDWITEEQAQELLQRRTTSLWDLRKRKKIIASKIGNRTYYDRKSIITYLNKNKTQ